MPSANELDPLYQPIEESLLKVPGSYGTPTSLRHFTQNLIGNYITTGKNQVLILAGDPGNGKSTTERAAVSLIENDPRIVQYKQDHNLEEVMDRVGFEDQFRYTNRYRPPADAPFEEWDLFLRRTSKLVEYQLVTHLKRTVDSPRITRLVIPGLTTITLDGEKFGLVDAAATLAWRVSRHADRFAQFDYDTSAIAIHGSDEVRGQAKISRLKATQDPARAREFYEDLHLSPEELEERLKGGNAAVATIERFEDWLDKLLIQLGTRGKITPRHGRDNDTYIPQEVYSLFLGPEGFNIREDLAFPAANIMRFRSFTEENGDSEAA